jgi:hypothetical protein
MRNDFSFCTGNLSSGRVASCQGCISQYLLSAVFRYGDWWHVDCLHLHANAGGIACSKRFLGVLMDTKRVDKVKTSDPAANPDPITHAPGAHPVGSGIGAAAGGAAGIGAAVAAGAIAGTAAGPIGTAAGAVIGGVAGGLIGKGVAEGVNPTVEHEYWRQNYVQRPYVTAGMSYEEVGPAYQLGWEARSQHSNESFEQLEASLSDDWNRAKGKSRLKWDQAKQAARDAWDHVDANRQQD